ncbi:MAG: amidohydrolase [Chloroflexota bacterium]|nr:amidohydrolase [Chloroflexota bacterium]
MHVGDGTSAEALLARDGWVAAVGALRDLARDAPGADVLDVRGGLLVPGWFDSHVHFMWWSIQMRQVDLRGSESVEAALDVVGGHARELPAGAWVVGGRFDKNRWGRWPTAALLDGVTRGHPAALRSRDGHSRWLNSEALRRAGITSDTPEPEGGAIERDAAGEPTGILKENANRLADGVVPAPTEEECTQALRRGQEEAWRRGIVGIEDLEQGDAFGAFQRLHARGELAMRVVMGVPHARLDDAIALGIRSGLGDEWLRVGHCKMFADGALGSQTAALEEPYEGTEDRGIMTCDPAVLARDAAKAARAGIAVAIHAIGDRAVHAALDALEPVIGTDPALRHRLEHIQLVRADDLVRFGALGVVASMQPIHATSDRDLVDRYWGHARATRAYPWRSIAEGGGVLAFGSDAPVEPIDPLLGIHAAVARRRPGDATPWHPEQALSLNEALAAYASGSAHATDRAREWGTLRPGMRCDATVIDRDLAALPPHEWLDARAAATIVGGAVRHASG